MTTQPLDFLKEKTSSLLQKYQTCKIMAKNHASGIKVDNERLIYARSYCSCIVAAYWNTLSKKHKSSIRLRSVPASVEFILLSDETKELASATGVLISRFPSEDAGYLIGSIYTVMLPVTYRSDMGAYYTPPPLVSRLLDLSEQAGVDFSKASVIDPACGGGAFLAPVALRMLSKEKGNSPEWIFRRLVKRLKGIEIDPFAAWMSAVLLESVLIKLCIETKRRLPADIIIVGDALTQENIGEFDLVIGNPPYGRVTLSPEMRSKFSRSLFGHANLYGLFTDLAARFVRPDTGVVAFLTPTSFLGGQYFTALRKLLTETMSPLAFDFVTDRDGVFDDVLQETMLTVFKAGQHKQQTNVSLLIPKGLNKARVEKVGNVYIEKGGKTWLLPRGKQDINFLNRLRHMPTRLADLGYSVSTGQLVWNRFKDQLRKSKNAISYPLIWAESITPVGFSFNAARKNHVPYVEVRQKQEYLLTSKECVLVQRTTSKEQDKRILAALLPQNFIDISGGVVVENHINIVYPNGILNQISPEVISALLNSRVVDRAFRCISGSVAVSAFELNSIPLPALEQLSELQMLLNSTSEKELIEEKIASFYGVV
ncbi:class I SAM-dependent DNA methyltransferase [Klebsiella africana]|uniref:site-specific DNA-methyltransferase (adenine-specific) n=1 Tax=Klebsiella africana TaxID=2489010 RepID=A0A8B6J132_9ENTR|nr:N-6 DNA methylase [Klebsiella africana]UDD39861.1 Eco57I restriction-modification methylase domain-containing protein [Klebsiella africana]VGQ13808.1 Modification methylase TaqI [Klebsiella africana]